MYYISTREDLENCLIENKREIYLSFENLNKLLEILEFKQTKRYSLPDLGEYYIISVKFSLAYGIWDYELIRVYDNDKLNINTMMFMGDIDPNDWL